MFFYVSLFIACVITAILALYLFHVIADVGNAVFKGILPGQKNRSARNARNVRHVRSSSKSRDAQTPWGWTSNDHGARKHVAKGAVLNGATGLDAFVNKHSNESTSVGWPYREEKNEFAGKAYKVTRKPTSKKPRLNTTGSQPWGW